MYMYMNKYKSSMCACTSFLKQPSYIYKLHNYFLHKYTHTLYMYMCTCIMFNTECMDTEQIPIIHMYCRALHLNCRFPPPTPAKTMYMYDLCLSESISITINGPAYASTGIQ